MGCGWACQLNEKKGGKWNLFAKAARLKKHRDAPPAVGSCGTSREFWNDWNDGWRVSWTGAVAGAAPPRGELQELDQRERVESCGRFGLGVAIGGCSRGEVGFRGQHWDHARDRQHTRGRMHCKGAD